MRETIEWITSAWNNYWGTGSFQYLLLVAVIYLIGWKRKKDSVRQSLAYLLAVLFLFLCPLSAAIIRKCIGEDVYWRVLWLLPVTQVIALAGAEFPENRSPKFLRSGLAVVFVGATVVCANSLLQSGDYSLAYNYQKVPNEVAHICNLVQENAGGGTVRLAADDHVATYVRVYDPSILMPYGRRINGAANWDSKLLYWAINKEERHYDYIAKLAKSLDCNFISVAVPDDPEDFDVSLMEDVGYEQIGTVNQYGIFQLRS